MDRIAIVVYDGVLDDECVAFRTVLAHVGASEMVAVGPRRGPFAGPGGTQTAERSFDEVRHADVVVVPGGLGCERAADDPALREFLQRMERTARFVAASSTGSVVLAAAGLLHGEAAATHWLAGDLLGRYGSPADDRRLVVTGNVITCEGRISAVDAAFALVERLGGSAEVDRIRATLLDGGRPLLDPPSWRERVRQRLRGRRSRSAVATSATRRPTGVANDPTGASATPLSVMVELVDDADLARRMKRRADRSRRR